MTIDIEMCTREEGRSDLTWELKLSRQPGVGFASIAPPAQGSGICPPPLCPSMRQRTRNNDCVSDLVRAKAVLGLMLDLDFEGAETYRHQLESAELTRHETGCSIAVDRSRAGPAPYDERIPGARLPVEASGHGKLLVWLHGFEGYLDDVELLNATRFPDPASVRIRST